MNKSDLTHFRNAITLSQKWLHLAIYLGYLAAEHGADQAEIDRLIRLGTKDEIDKLLLDKMKGQDDEYTPKRYFNGSTNA